MHALPSPRPWLAQALRNLCRTARGVAFHRAFVDGWRRPGLCVLAVKVVIPYARARSAEDANIGENYVEHSWDWA